MYGVFYSVPDKKGNYTHKHVVNYKFIKKKTTQQWNGCVRTDGMALVKFSAISRRHIEWDEVILCCFVFFTAHKYWWTHRLILYSKLTIFFVCFIKKKINWINTDIKCHYVCCDHFRVVETQQNLTQSYRLVIRRYMYKIHEFVLCVV